MIEDKQHSFFMENRKKMTLTGVIDVSSFDEEKVVLKTSLGGLTIKGVGLHILGFNQDIGELNIEGVLCSYFYSEGQAQKESLISRIFK